MRSTSGPVLLHLPYDNDWLILYLPLSRIALKVRADMHAYLDRMEKGDVVPFTKDEKRFHSLLSELKVLDVKPPEAQEVEDFSPTNATICPTTDCNLRCLYCYAEGGKTSLSIDPALASSIIRYISANAIKYGDSSTQLAFHGGGEPTFHSGLFKTIVEDYLQYSSSMELEPDLTVTTNAVMSSDMARYLCSHFSHAGISIDGSPRTQNRQRPTASGQGSFEAVRKTIAIFDDKGLDYSFRLTVSRDSLDTLIEDVQFLVDTFAPTSLQIEPLNFCGRCWDSDLEVPDHRHFCDVFYETMLYCLQKGLQCSYSGFSLDVKTEFCSARQGNLFLTPQGTITSCLEVLSPEDPRAETFFLGHVDAENVHIDFQKLQNISKMSVYNFPECEHCICRFHCAGDCLAKRLVDSSTNPDASRHRCSVNRGIMQRYLTDAVSGKAPLVQTLADCEAAATIQPRPLTLD